MSWHSPKRIPCLASPTDYLTVTSLVLPQTLPRPTGDDFEKEKVCEETIEVKNDMIVFEPSRGRATLSLPRRKPPQVSRRPISAAPQIHTSSQSRVIYI